MKILFRLLLLVFFIFILVIIIAFARGYRFDFENRIVSSTGILAISSNPKAAKVYINDGLKGVTDLNITLSPGTYKVSIKKEGYTAWSKEIKLRGELVMSLDALLLPLNPSLSPLTNLGIVKAIPLYQTEQIILFSDTGDEVKDGIYLFDSGNKPISFLPPLKLLTLKKDLVTLTGVIDLSKTTVNLSPDNKQAIFDFFLQSGLGEESVSYLLPLDEQNPSPFDVSSSKETLITAWTKQKEEDNLKILESFPKQFTKIATDSMHIVYFSPDETKLLYRAIKELSLPFIIKPRLIATNQTEEKRTLEQDSLYVYDKKEDRNYQISNAPSQTDPLWYFDSKHLLFLDGKKISMVDFDGHNIQTVYSGPFENSLFTTTSDGRIIILANLNPDSNIYPDLYSVGR